MMSAEIVVSIIAFFASLLTFFCGFGLGTLLLPVFAMFYDVKSAVLLTASVHLFNNLFKFSLVFKHVDWRKALSFSVFALPASFIGAWLLSGITLADEFSFQCKWGSYLFTFSLVSFGLGLLMVFFGIWELIPRFQSLRISEKWFAPIAFLSGLIGGFSGHQGALRTVVLSQAKLDKQAFIATGIVIACLVDLTRIPIYLSETSIHEFAFQAFLPAVLPAFGGAWLGNRFLKKMEFKWLKWLIGVYLIAMGVLVLLNVV